MPDADETDTVETEVEQTADDERRDETDDAETFPRAYVEKLRKENKGYRDRAKTAEERATELEQSNDALARQLFTAKVAATGKLADPADLAYDADLMDDPDKLTAAVDSLIEAKPHLKLVKFEPPAQRQKGIKVKDTAELVEALQKKGLI